MGEVRTCWKERVGVTCQNSSLDPNSPPQPSPGPSAAAVRFGRVFDPIWKNHNHNQWFGSQILRTTTKTDGFGSKWFGSGSKPVPSGSYYLPYDM